MNMRVGGPERHLTPPNRSHASRSVAFIDEEPRDDRFMEGQRFRPFSATRPPSRCSLSILRRLSIPRATADWSTNTDRVNSSDRDDLRITTAERRSVEQRNAVGNGIEPEKASEACVTGADSIQWNTSCTEKGDNTHERLITVLSEKVHRRQRWKQRQQRQQQKPWLGSNNNTRRSSSSAQEENNATTPGANRESVTRTRSDRPGRSGGVDASVDVTLEGENDSPVMNARIAVAEARARAKIDALGRAFRLSVAL